MSETIKRVSLTCTEPKCLIDNEILKVSIFNDSKGKYSLQITTIDLSHVGGKPHIIISLNK